MDIALLKDLGLPVFCLIACGGFIYQLVNYIKQTLTDTIALNKQLSETNKELCETNRQLCENINCKLDTILNKIDK